MLASIPNDFRNQYPIKYASNDFRNQYAGKYMSSDFWNQYALMINIFRLVVYAINDAMNKITRSVQMPIFSKSF